MSDSRRMATTSSMRLVATTNDPTQLAGAIVVHQLHGLLRAATMYEPGHPQVRQQATRFLNAIRPQFDSLGSDTITVVLTGSHVFVNRIAVRADAADYTRVQWLTQQLGRLNVVEVEFKRSVTETELTSLCERVALALHGTAGFEDVRDLGGLQALTSSLDPDFERDLQGLLRLTRYPMLQLYAEGLALARAWENAIQNGGAVDCVAAKRLAGQIVDAFHVDTGGVLGLVQLLPLGHDGGERRLNAAIVAAGLGLHAGLSDLQVRELAVTALIRPGPASFTPWITRQPVAPVEAAVVAARAPGPLPAIAAYEALAPGGVHIAPTYYGAERFRHPVSLLLSLAEAYVELLDPGPGNSPFAPDMAVQILIAQAGGYFDADLVRCLVSLLGLWPPGTTVQLNSGDRAVVVESPPVGSDLGRPTVRLIDVLSTQVYPLWKPDLAAYSIVASVPPSSSPLNPRYVFLR